MNVGGEVNSPPILLYKYEEHFRLDLIHWVITLTAWALSLKKYFVGLFAW